MNPAVLAAIIQAIFPNSSIAKAITPDIVEQIGELVLNTVKYVQEQFGNKPNKFKHAQALGKLKETMVYRDEFDLDQLIHKFVEIMKSETGESGGNSVVGVMRSTTDDTGG